MRLVIALALVVGLVGCGSSIQSVEPIELTDDQLALVKEEAANAMKDPQSAQFRNIRAAMVTFEGQSPKIDVCGEMNARNAFGGYVGFKTFYGFFEDDGSFRFLSVDPANSSIGGARYTCETRLGI